MEARARAIASIVDLALSGDEGPLLEAYVPVGRLPAAYLEVWCEELTREAAAQGRAARALRDGGPPVPARLVRAVELMLRSSGARQALRGRDTGGS